MVGFRSDVDSADVVVIGFGAMGSATVDALASREHRVLGVDAWGPDHTRGSSHGMTRVIRRVIEEGGFFEPLIADAFERWSALEADSNQELVNRCGVIRIGLPTSPLLVAVQMAAENARLEIERLGAEEISKRFPGFHVPDDHVAIFEPAGGVLYAQRALRALRARAQSRGASLRFNEAVLDWRLDGDGVVVTTARANYRCDRLVIAAGAWTARLAHGLALPLVANRVVNVTFEPACRTRYQTPAFPAFIIAADAGGDGLPSLHGMYGTPAVPDYGVKVGLSGTPTDPEHVDRTVTDSEIRRLRVLVERWLPDAFGSITSTLTCLYTRTPDEHFVLGVDPNMPQVVIASPCSGHGFKFTPTIGALLADPASDVPPPFDLAPFAPQRFATMA